MTYSQKLRDPRWQRKRLEILQRDDFTCLNCGSKTNTLHVHHSVYLKGFEPWDYNQSLITLCEVCHENRQEIQNFLSVATSRLKNEEMTSLANLFASMFNLKIADGTSPPPDKEIKRFNRYMGKILYGNNNKNQANRKIHSSTK